MPNRTKDDLWERQPGESAQAYEAFAIYRDMGSNRSLRVVAEQLSKSDTLIKRWSREKKWGERCRAYDNHLDDVARQEALRPATSASHCSSKRKPSRSSRICRTGR